MTYWTVKHKEDGRYLQVIGGKTPRLYVSEGVAKAALTSRVMRYSQQNWEVVPVTIKEI